jgi:hypothetical protein
VYPSDMLTVLYLSFNFYLICWLYHIWHSTSIWYTDCIISVIPLLEKKKKRKWDLFLYLGYTQCIYTLNIISENMIPLFLFTIFQIWYSQPIRWKWNDRYDTVNTSIGSGMTYMIQSTHQMEVEWHMVQSTYQTVLYLSFNFYLICWLYHIWHSTSIWYADCIISVIPLLEKKKKRKWDLSLYLGYTQCWQIWYSQHIRWKYHRNNQYRHILKFHDWWIEKKLVLPVWNKR